MNNSVYGQPEAKLHEYLRSYLSDEMFRAFRTVSLLIYLLRKTFFVCLFAPLQLPNSPHQSQYYISVRIR